MSSRKRRQKPPFHRIKDNCRLFTAFMFSNVGIILLVIFYILGGAFIFQAIEKAEHDKVMERNPFRGRNLTEECLTQIWKKTLMNISFYDSSTYKEEINTILSKYQKEIYLKKEFGEDADVKWSLSGAFLFCLTVITTIGYGNISPQSDWGKLVTILYAILGMPLFLLYLSNIGDVLAKSFKWIYSKVCLCRICPEVAKRRMLRERKKERQLARRLKVLQQIDNASYGSSSQSSMKSSNSTSSYSDVSQSNEDEEDMSDTDCDITSTGEITVPLTVCIIIMISYVLYGAFLFGHWEDWGFLNGSYFCFISLSSIGFGDFVPGETVNTASDNYMEARFIMCAVYLLLGMALIAMCFNLMQEQVIHNVRAVKRAFRSCFNCRR